MFFNWLPKKPDKEKEILSWKLETLLIKFLFCLAFLIVVAVVFCLGIIIYSIYLAI